MYILFSVFRSENNAMVNELNLHRTKKLLDYHGIAYIEALGCYKGSKEQSLKVPMTALSIVQSIASKYNQESILLVDSASQSSLLFANGEMIDLGIFSQISEAVALQSEAWTMIDNKFYRAGV
jgi:hypothetical protein